jgi:hypothetical protein
MKYDSVMSKKLKGTKRREDLILGWGSGCGLNSTNVNLEIPVTERGVKRRRWINVEKNLDP